MRFKLNLESQQGKITIPFNNQYPLSAAIYKILDKPDSEYAQFLLEKGYQVGDSQKDFTFSDLKLNFKPKGDRMQVLSPMELLVSFHLPNVAENFIKGFFFLKT